TCMVFFQALLLAGYAYAHASTKFLGARRQALLHLAVLALPFLTLGLTVDRGLLDYGESNPIPKLLLVLVLSVGLPFFVVSASALLLWRSPVRELRAEWQGGDASPSEDPYAHGLTLWRILRWIALAFVPSSLMLGATTYMTTDIAAIPLLWVLPLGLYLLSFIIVFSKVPPVVHKIAVLALPLTLLLLVFMTLSEIRPPKIAYTIGIHLLTLF